MTTRMDLRTESCGRGFTLLEMLVVLAILAILALSASSGISTSVPALRFKAETQMLADGLRAARRAAILQQREASVVMMPDSYTSSDESRPHVLPSGMQLTLSAPTGHRRQTDDCIRFFADGSSTGGRIQMKMGERHSVVVVDWLTGRVTADD